MLDMASAIMWQIFFQSNLKSVLNIQRWSAYIKQSLYKDQFTK